VGEVSLSLTEPLAAESASDEARLRAMFADHFDFIWRSLRRLGMPGDRADDAAQSVFVVASRRLASIEVGRERAFLFATAVRVASDVRRSAARRREVSGDDVAEAIDPAPHPDERIDRERARAMLDAVLDALPMELRVVFVLFELEEMATPQIATLLSIPPGTAASRLRRAREAFQATVARMKARGEVRGGGR
jgi:RNA polymerase sigma-70 factor (ECF subfamily)